MGRISLVSLGVLSLFFLFFQSAFAVEGIQENPTVVRQRRHPKTGTSYRVITSRAVTAPRYIRQEEPLAVMRPDYRLLDPNTRPGEIPYEGPFSDRKKIYFLAGALATGGILGGALTPVAAGGAAAASGGAGTYALAGSALAAGAGTAAAGLYQDSKKVSHDYVRESKSNRLKVEP